MVLLSLLKGCYLTHWICWLLKCLLNIDYNVQTKICFFSIIWACITQGDGKHLFHITSLDLICIFYLQDKAFWKTGWLLKLPKVLWYLQGSLLGDLNIQVLLVQSSFSVVMKTWREWRCGKLFKGFASHAEQPWGFVYCRGEKMAVAATWFEVIGVTSISALPLEQKKN